MAENADKQPKIEPAADLLEKSEQETASPASLQASFLPIIFSTDAVLRKQVMQMQRTMGNQKTMQWLHQQAHRVEQDIPQTQEDTRNTTITSPGAQAVSEVTPSPALKTGRASRSGTSSDGKLNPSSPEGDLEQNLTDDQISMQDDLVTTNEPPDAPTENNASAQISNGSVDPLSLSQPLNMARMSSSSASRLQRTPRSVDPNVSTAYELQVPEPKKGLSFGEKKRVESVQTRMTETSQAQTDLPPAVESTTQARQAVTEPSQESDARAGEELATEFSQDTRPSLEIEAMCERIRIAIRNRRPPSEDSLINSNPAEAAAAAGNELNTSLQSEAKQVEGEYAALDQAPTGTPSREAQPMGPMPEAESTAETNAVSASPDAIQSDEVSLDADTKANQQRIEQAGMNSNTAQLVESGPIAEARAAQAELEESAQTDPQQVMADQQAAIDAARADMSELQARALKALHTSRSKTSSTIRTGQSGMVGSEEQMRQQIGEQSQTIFETAQQQVGDLLGNLSQNAMQRWDAGVAQLSTTFESRLSDVATWIEERHGDGVIGSVTAGWDSVFGYPGWIVEAYDTAENTFADGVCDLLRDISSEVNGLVAACHAVIQQARDDISSLLSSLPPELQEWAMGEQARFEEQLTGLSTQAETTRSSFNQQITTQAAETVQSARERIYGLRQEAQGLVGRISNAIGEFLADPARFIIEGLLELVGIPPADFWALVGRIQTCMDAIAEDPIAFANNLVGALRTGFEQFFGNIDTHLMDGMLRWLFAGLGGMGIQAPQDFSLESVMTFFLQVMGISWTRIRQILTQHVGEDNVELVEQAWTLIADMIQQGPLGIFNLIRDQLDPQGLLDMIMEAALSYITETLIEQVASRILGMLNPAGAIIQAMEVIYRILDWVFNNAAQIFSLVETIVGGIADIVAGNISGMANAIEQSLSRILPMVIDFLAGFLGLGDLPERVVEIVRGLQQRVEETLNSVIGWLVTRAKSIVDAMTSKKDTTDEDEESAQTSKQAEPLNPEDEKKLEQGKHLIHAEEGKYANPEGAINENEAGQVAQTVQASPYFSSISVTDDGNHWEYDYVIQRSKTSHTITGAEKFPAEEVNMSSLMAKEVQAIRELIEGRLRLQSTTNNYALADYTLRYGDQVINGIHVAVSGRGRNDPESAYRSIQPALKEKWAMLTPEVKEAIRQNKMPKKMAPFEYSDHDDYGMEPHHFATKIPKGYTNADHTEPKLEEAIARDVIDEIVRLAKKQYGEEISPEQKKSIAKDLQLEIKLYTEAEPCISCGGTPPHNAPSNSLKKMFDWADKTGIPVENITLKVYYTFKKPEDRAAFYTFYQGWRTALGEHADRDLIIDLYYDQDFQKFAQTMQSSSGSRADAKTIVELYYDQDFQKFSRSIRDILGAQADEKMILELFKDTDFYGFFQSAHADEKTILNLLHDRTLRKFFLRVRKALGSEVSNKVILDLYHDKERLSLQEEFDDWANIKGLREPQAKILFQLAYE